MLRNQLPLVVGSWELTVWEANWDQASMPDKLAEEARKLRLSLNGSGDPDLLSFQEVVYPWLVAYTTGKEMPTPREVYALSDEELDVWHQAVRCTNPSIYPEALPEPTQVTFRDGSSVQVVSSYLPSSIRRLIILDNLAYKELKDHPEDMNGFARRKVYAKLACCTLGAYPLYKEIGEWPASELDKWYEAVLRTNPHLFLSSEDVAEVKRQEASISDSKKNPAPEKSSHSSKASSKRKGMTFHP
jgi:hypothetical protein